MDDLQRGWLAGLFEGEGCFTTAGRPLPGRKPSSYIAVYLVSTDEDVVTRAANLLNTKMFPVKSASDWSVKQQYRLALTGTRACNFMREMLPLLGERRATRVRELLALAEGPVELPPR
jgi:hypothetical protein